MINTKSRRMAASGVERTETWSRRWTQRPPIVLGMILFLQQCGGSQGFNSDMRMSYSCCQQMEMMT